MQGMGFLSGLLLPYMSEGDAFWLLVALLKGAVHEPMEGLYQVAVFDLKNIFISFFNLVWFGGCLVGEEIALLCFLIFSLLLYANT